MQYQNGQRYTQRRSRRKGRGARKALWAAVALLLIAAIAGGAVYLLSDRSPERKQYQATRDTFLPNVYVDGISLEGMTYNQAWDTVLKQMQEWQNSWTLAVSCDGFTYATLNYAAVGIQAEYQQLDDLLSAAWAYGHTGNYETFLADLNRLRQEPYRGEISQTGTADGDQIDYLLKVIREHVYRAPQDAKILEFNPNNRSAPFTFQADVSGRTIDAAAAREEILHFAATGQSGSYEVPIIAEPAQVTLEQVRQSVALLSEYSTAIDKHSIDERNDNISLAFSRINGTELENGKKFSFNKLVGKRNERNGFKEAIGYISGELAVVVGGGVCQASTTMYAAALCAGMSIQSRTPHSIPVSYISLGQDATVNDMRGHEIDLTFYNRTGSKVYITCGIEENAAGRLVCTARFWGQALENNAYYKLESTTVEVLPMPEEPVLRQDKTAKYVTFTDQRYKYSSGSDGYVVKTYLRLYQGDQVLKETLISTDTYKARADVYYVGVSER